jgi:hypothetical protein
MTDRLDQQPIDNADVHDKPLDARDLERDDSKSLADKAAEIIERSRENSRKSSLHASRDLTQQVKRDPQQDYQTLLGLHNNVNNILKKSGYFAQSNWTNTKTEAEDSYLRTPQRDNFYKYDINNLKYDTQLKQSGFIHTESPQKYDEKKLNAIIENIYKKKGLNFSASNNDIGFNKPTPLTSSQHQSWNPVINPVTVAAPEYSCGELQNDNDSFIEEITKKAEKDNGGAYYCGDIQPDQSVVD